MREKGEAGEKGDGKIEGRPRKRKPGKLVYTRGWRLTGRAIVPSFVGVMVYFKCLASDFIPTFLEKIYLNFFRNGILLLI